MKKNLKKLGLYLCAAVLFVHSTSVSYSQEADQEPKPDTVTQETEPKNIQEEVEDEQAEQENSQPAPEETDSKLEAPKPQLNEEEAQIENTQADEEAEPPEISYDLEALPFPTRRMHELILEATKTGDIEKLRAYIGTGDSMTMLSLAGVEGDPIDFLKQETGDEKGHEILAILEEILQAGYVHLDKGTDRELYVWPYFFAYPIDKLTAPQMVELFRIVTYGDYQDMKDFGGYIFYRTGISPTGRWTFFVAGD